MSKTSNIPALPDVPLGSSIPKIIHQVMMQGWDALPPEIVDSITALRDRNPDWEYRFYDASAVKTFIGETYGQAVLDIYNSIDPIYFSPRSDLFRYLVCYAEGGAYFDIKSTASKPLDMIIRPDDLNILSQWPALADVPPEAAGTMAAAHPELAHVPGYEYTNWFILTAPGHPFLKAAVRDVLGNIVNYDPFTDGVGHHCAMRLGGPVAYTLAVHPLIDTAPYRWGHLTDELGIEFSIYGDPFRHRKTLGVHYSKLSRPLVRQGLVKTAATQIWFGRLKPQIKRVKRKLGLT
ncbi:MAG: glycosyltransferase [Pseudomonadota bacterium]